MVTYIDNNERTKWIHDICETALAEANEIWRFDVRDYSQPMRLMTYHEGHHFQSWHQDHGPGRTCFRKLTLIVQLDQQDVDFGGGRFEIAGGDDIPSSYYQRGSAIVFPTYYYHRVDPVQWGLRRTIVHRACGPRFK